MGNQQSIQKLNFEDIQQIIKTPENYILINTLDKDLQVGIKRGHTVPIEVITSDESGSNRLYIFLNGHQVSAENISIEPGTGHREQNTAGG